MLTNSVCFFFFCVSLNFAFFAENTVKHGGFSPKKKKKKKHTQKKKQKKLALKNWSKLALKNWSKYVAQQNWTQFLTLEMGLLFLFIFYLFLPNPLLSAGRTRFSKNKKNKKTKKTWDQFFNTRKGKKLDQLLTLQHIYIYIYMPAGSPAGWEIIVFFFFHFCRFEASWAKKRSKIEKKQRKIQENYKKKKQEKERNRDNPKKTIKERKG